MVVTKTADESAGSLETEQRNMSEHDFLNGRVPHATHGSPPRQNPLKLLIIESTGWRRLWLRRLDFSEMESLILAQNERWRHGLGMQVERDPSGSSGGRVSNT